MDATLHTNKGDIRITLFPDHAPKTVRNFTGLATGEQQWTDPSTGAKRNDPFYDGLTFHRIIPNFMIQGGCPQGTGMGGPGYAFDDEIHPELTFTKPYLLGRARFVALYLISAVGGSVGFLLLADPTNPFSWYAPVVGASGAVFGLFGATVLVLRKLRLDTRPLVGVIVINAVLGFVISGIAWQAHLGGLVAGTAVTAVLVHAPSRRRSVAQIAGVALVTLVIVLAAWLRLATTSF
jgi:cyclophilin family peptidyl-prolyl cis-trans isomerase